MDRIDKIVAVLDKISEWSLYLIIFCLPFSKSIVEIMITTALVSFIIKKIITKERFFTDDKYVDIMLCVFVVSALFSLLNSSYMNLSVRAFFSKTVKFAALFLVTKEILNTKTKLNNFIIMAILSCIIILADGFIQDFVTHRDILHNYLSFKYVYFFKGYPTASFPFPNDFAAWVTIFIFPAGIFSLFGKRKYFRERILSGFVFICLAYFIIATKVRGAWAGGLFSICILSCVHPKKIGIFLLVIVILFAVFGNSALRTDMLSLSSMKDRADMWGNGWEIFKKHPIIGTGLNTFYVNYAKVRNDKDKYKKGSYAHNCYLQMAAETGLVGLVSFLLFIMAVIIRVGIYMKKAKDSPYNPLILGVGLGLIAFLVHSFFDTNLYSLNLAALFWISAGAMMAMIRVCENPK